jgi:gas vesicle protein
MSEKSGYHGGHLALAFLGGAAAGAAVALLTAPQSGAKSRALIRERVLTTGESAAQLPTALQGALSAARDAFNESLSKGLDERG